MNTPETLSAGSLHPAGSAFWLTGYQRLWAKLDNGNRAMKLWRKLRRAENRYQRDNGMGKYSMPNTQVRRDAGPTMEETQ